MDKIARKQNSVLEDSMGSQETPLNFSRNFYAYKCVFFTFFMAVGLSSWQNMEKNSTSPYHHVWHIILFVLERQTKVIPTTFLKKLIFTPVFDKNVKNKVFRSETWKYKASSYHHVWHTMLFVLERQTKVFPTTFLKKLIFTHVFDKNAKKGYFRGET